METDEKDTPLHLAAISCVLGDLSQSDGSTVLTQGNTVVSVAVYGPCEVKQSKERLDKATVEVTYKPKVGLPKVEDKFCENIIGSVFEEAILVTMHPRSSISIVLQIVEDAGAILAASINAACLALLDAGVNMKFLVAATTALLDSDGKVYIAPYYGKIDVVASITFVLNDKDLNIVSVTSDGKLSLEQYDLCWARCVEASKAVFQFYRESLDRKLSKSLRDG